MRAAEQVCGVRKEAQRLETTHFGVIQAFLWESRCPTGGNYTPVLSSPLGLPAEMHGIVLVERKVCRKAKMPENRINSKSIAVTGLDILVDWSDRWLMGNITMISIYASRRDGAVSM
jgi:hypothetical protein